MKIGLDLDGVVYPFEQCIREWFEKEHPGGDYSAAATEWKFYKGWTMPDGTVQSGNDFHRSMTTATAYGHLYRSQPIDPAWLLAANDWQREGHTIHLITHRTGHGVADATSAWLEDVGFPYDTLTFGMDKTIVDADLLVDDKPENVETWVKATGKPGLIFEQKYNRGYPGFRVFNVQHLDEIIGFMSRAQPAEEETILQEAQRLVHGDRGEDYGHPALDFQRTAEIWNAIFADMLRDGHQFDARHVPLAMIGVKMSREVNRHKRDNLADMAGYAETLSMVHDYRESH